MKITLKTELCRRLGIRYPIILAGMAGGPTTAGLVASVSQAGGLGTLGAAYMNPDQIREAIREIRKITAAPFGVNLFADRSADDYRRFAEVKPVLNSLRASLGLEPADTPPAPASYTLEEQIEVLLEEQVPVISTAFGPLPNDYRQAVRKAGLITTTMVTTVQEAVIAEEGGSDVIVAQGGEAGGHRSTFDVSSLPQGALIGTMALVPQVVDRVKVPVIAAGGIMDGRGVVASLALGAQAAQLGTRFLTAAESGAHPAYQKALLQSTEESTVVTRVFSGRPARGIKNEFVRRFDESGAEPLPFPAQNAATREIRNASARADNPEYLSLWAGQGTRMLTAGDRAGDIVASLVKEAEELLKG
ncbi:nitronate monooxygenase [Paenibacillus sp. P25]|nr:nitronate monooxygenase [Paenibacillus sp. P25]